MHHFLQDLRFSLRLLARTPGFTAAAIAVLALGIGANTAIFSLVHELIWSPRPYPHPAQVVQLYTQDQKNPKKFRQFSYPTYRDIAAQNTIFSGVLAHNLTLVGVGEGDTSRRTFAAVVSSNYFSVLGVPLARGRGFTADEEKPGADVQVAIASWLYWQKSGFDPALIGRTVRVNERPFTIVGITPEHFTGTMMLFGPELYFPLGVHDLLANDFEAAAKQSLTRRDAYNLFVVARLNPGVSLDAAAPALQTLASNLERAWPVEQKDQTLIARTLPRLSTSDAPAGDDDLGMLGLLLVGMAAIVLLIACLNLANMLLARGTARRKEIAIRLALGGGRARIVRQLLTEGFVLALGGGAAGLLLAIWSAGLLVRSLTALLPVTMFFRGAANPAIFGATLAFCLFATLFFALGPALKLTRADVIGDLKEQAGEDVVRRRRWLPRNPLVVLQIALSLALLTAAGLFIRGALKAGSVETGFQTGHTIIAEVDASLGGYSQAQSLQLYNAINDHLAALPGVAASSIGSVVPFGFVSMSRPVQRAGITLGPDAHPSTAAEGLAYTARWNSIGTGYFSAMGLSLLRGRNFTTAETDHTGAPSVAVIDEVLAKKLFPDGDALGQRIQWADRNAPRAKSGSTGNMGSSDDIARRADESQPIEIVGIVPATRWELFEKEPGGAIYVPFAQGFQSNAFFHVRTAGGSPESDRAMLDAIRHAIHAAAPGVPLFNIKPFATHINSSVQLWTVRAGAAMFGVFGGLALVLAVVGLYGVKAYSVSRRTREIGIRMALGAEPGAVQRLILREGATMTLAGIALGLLLGLGVGQACAGLLYRVDALDPYAFTLAPLVLAAAALAACWLPARRATKIEPIRALRAE
ncbi:MAG TPA: ADOP family duplicated permease [Opitutus sp.]|nr:ADOP family duplicated permease [Opitutus sp.]